jgi:pimeloyl-ACP methyl ester carboxylesterase
MSSGANKKKRTTLTDVLLVHGGWHGGWCWDAVAHRLARLGHRVLAPTLSGLGDRSHLGASTVGLDTHITDVVNAATWGELDDFVLCGHSYGGMVISGAAEHLVGRIRGLVYVDAFLPANGQSCADLASGSPPVRDSLVPPPPAEAFGIASATERARVQRLMTPHPANTLLDTVALTDARDRIERKTYILATSSSTPDFARAHASIAADPAWRTFGLPTGHHPMMDAPDALVDIISESAR